MKTAFDLKLKKEITFQTTYKATVYTVRDVLTIECYKCDDLGKWVISVLVNDFDGECLNFHTFPTFNTKKSACEHVVEFFSLTNKNASYHLPSF